jgi:hypothetical protein
MTTKLEGQLKREIAVGDDAYTLTLSSEGFVIARNGPAQGARNPLGRSREW